MKKLNLSLCSFLVAITCQSYADGIAQNSNIQNPESSQLNTTVSNNTVTSENNSTTPNFLANNTDHSKMMYLDFGLGVGTADQFIGPSLAINAADMGFYFNKNWGVEVGMDALPDGANSVGEGMIMSYHMAAKGIVPLSDSFNLYGKAGLGINAYEGEAPNNNDMSMTNQASIGLYYAAGMQFNFNQNFGIYLEGSSIAVPNIGNNGSTSQGSFGSTYMGTVGLEVRI